MHSHHLETTRTARYFTLGEPGPGVTDLWIACHGYGQSAETFLKEFEVIVRPDRVIAAPEALSRFYVAAPGTAHRKDTPVGGSWMTREDRDAEISDYVAYLDALVRLLRQQVAPGARVRALGFSQGMPTIYRWLALGAEPVTEAILWAGELPRDTDDDAVKTKLGDAPVSLVAGTNDRYISPAMFHAFTSRLQRAGLNVTARTFDGGHRLDRETLSKLASP
jgi:predicted esterase